MPRRRRVQANRPERDENADRDRVVDLLARLAELLRRGAHPRADEVDALRLSFATDPAAAWKRLDGNSWWAGAGSLAAEGLVEPEALPVAERAMAMRELRTLLIEIAELLRQRGPTNPGLSSWLLAFRNWEASGV